MDYKQALIDLIAFLQYDGVLSTDSKVYKELSDVIGWTEEEIEEELF